MIKKLLLSTIIAFLFISLKGQAQSDYLIQIGLKDSVHSEVLNETREFYVVLPDSYVEGSDTKYPVVFLLDGDVMLNALQTVHSFYSGGFMPDMILVGISNAESRTRDLTTSELSERRGQAYNQENGAADKFTSFIESELIPFVEDHYPVTNYRTLIGHSYGGLFTVNMLLNHTELFENYLAIDPSMDWDQQKLLKESKDILSQKSFAGKSLFVSLGGQLHMADTDITIDNVMKDTTEYTLFARSIIEMSEIMKANKENELNFQWKFYPNDLHGTIPLPSIMDGMIGLFSWYQMEDINKFNDPQTPNDVLYQIIKRREKKLKEHFGYAVAPYPNFLFNMSGYMSMDMGNFDKALMYFQLNTEYFPNDANAYDSLADYYESQNDTENALKNVTKAYELSGSDAHKERLEGLKGK
ncbi:alpha/beta hydrolase-fold protein [Lutimonas halocynthiae]|uniref:alpha/beta hydrolase-fold protein n=1 Tax=Lutimonas halocynthiae TaxID=1446477 RepID=UPI0025B57A50|nr:alpha/beta hydrolase-fold protein [Lutimonas halocynthiae]MDN3644036.1 alpha/beta hydrolase-fold protein [Lutimonas halocynthiae]